MWGWLNIQIQNLGYGGTTDTEEPGILRTYYKLLHVDFRLLGGLSPITPALFKGQVYIFIINQSIISGQLSKSRNYSMFKEKETDINNQRL